MVKALTVDLEVPGSVPTSQQGFTFTFRFSQAQELRPGNEATSGCTHPRYKSRRRDITFVSFGRDVYIQ